jgi:hypothetical protein
MVPETQPINGAKDGVAIILPPELAHQWKSSGSEKIIVRGGISTGETTRLLSISMKFKLCSANHQKPKHNNLCLSTIYFPHLRALRI